MDPTVALFLASTVAAASPCGDWTANAGSIVTDRELASRVDTLVTRFAEETGLFPGLSIAVVNDGAVAYIAGYGYRDLERCTAASANARYYLKSTTKSFLGVGMALLHERGAIELDAPISEYLPELKLTDGVDPSLTTLRDHLTHTQPYWAGGLNYRTAFPGNMPATEFVPHINTYGRRKPRRFRYSNFGPIVAAHAVAEKTGVGWRALIERDVFGRVGMSDSFAHIEKAKARNCARSYIGNATDGFVPVATKVESQMHAAGGTVSTARDLARWVVLNLGTGEVDGERLLPRRAIERAHARSVDIDWTFGEIRRFATGLGIYSGDYEGEVLMHHFGGETHVSFMPERGTGVVVLTNNIGHGVYATHELALTIYDTLLGRGDIEARLTRRLAESKRLLDRRKQRLAEYLEGQRSRVGPGPRILSPNQIVGRYRQERMGEIVIANKGGDLVVRYGALAGRLEHLGGDHYLAHMSAWGAPPVPFEFVREGTGTELRWEDRIFPKAEGP